MPDPAKLASHPGPPWKPDLHVLITHLFPSWEFWSELLEENLCCSFVLSRYHTHEYSLGKWWQPFTWYLDLAPPSFVFISHHTSGICLNMTCCQSSATFYKYKTAAHYGRCNNKLVSSWPTELPSHRGKGAELLARLRSMILVPTSLAEYPRVSSGQSRWHMFRK